jgi:hypothetical protein
MWAKLACGKTKFETHYRWHSDADPFVPDTKIPRLKPISLGERNIAYLEHEGDALINALAKLRDTAKAGGHSESKPHERKVARKAKVGTQTTFLTDAMPRKLLDPELAAHLEEIERKLRALEQKR